MSLFLDPKKPTLEVQPEQTNPSSVNPVNSLMSSAPPQETINSVSTAANNVFLPSNPSHSLHTASLVQTAPLGPNVDQLLEDPFKIYQLMGFIIGNQMRVP